MSRHVSNYQQKNSTLETLGGMKETALVTTVFLGVAYVGKLAIDAIRNS